MSLPRILSQVVILGSQILGRAFVEAYKQAAKNARAGSASSGGGGAGGPAVMTGSALTRKHRMAVDEACQILNIRNVEFTAGPQDPAVAKELEGMLKAYETMFKANEGSSRYLLSKVVRARDRIEAELQMGGPAGGAGTGAQSTAGGPSAAAGSSAAGSGASGGGGGAPPPS